MIFDCMMNELDSGHRYTEDPVAKQPLLLYLPASAAKLWNPSIALQGNVTHSSQSEQTLGHV